MHDFPYLRMNCHYAVEGVKPRPFEGGFGVFDDCLPDGWGLLILDRYLQQNGIKPCVLSLLDRLVLVGSTGRGALEFRPDKSVVSKQELSLIHIYSKVVII